MKDTGHPESDSDTEPTGGGSAYGGGDVKGVGRVSRGRGCCKNNLHPGPGSAFQIGQWLPALASVPRAISYCKEPHWRLGCWQHTRVGGTEDGLCRTIGTRALSGRHLRRDLSGKGKQTPSAISELPCVANILT